MSRVGIIANPRSRGYRRQAAALREVLSRHPEVACLELGDGADCDRILREFAGRGVDVIVIGGGDGTIHSVMTALLNGRMFERLPALGILPLGMTNLIAANLGLRRPTEVGLSRLLDRTGDPLARTRRRILSVRHPGWKQPAHGMMFGSAGFYRGVLLGYSRIHPLGGQRWLLDGATLALALVQAILGRAGPDSVFEGHRMTIAVDGAGTPAQDYILVLATTLDRLSFGIEPFWGDGEGTVRLTTVSFPPQRLLRALLPLLRGRPRPWMREQGYVSCNAQEVSLTTDCPVVLDGEILTVDGRHPLTITADAAFDFVQC